MKRLVTVILTWICTVIAMEAQTFTDHLRRRDPKTQGVVTISQSAAIEQLVNGKGGAGKWANPNPNERSTQTTMPHRHTLPIAVCETAADWVR